MAFKMNDSMMGNIGRVADNALKLEAQDSFRLDYIDIHKVSSSEKNFYRIDDIEQLAADIEANGLQHNIVVRRTAGEHYELISGERRFTAYTLLFEKYGDKFRLIPAKITTLNDVDAEIALIQSNAQVRTLSPGELLMQVERMKELYKEKKQRGEKLGGRIREVIAADLGMSATQIGKYEKLSERLSEEEKEEFREGNINLSKALELVEQSDTQRKSECKNDAPRAVKYRYKCPGCRVVLWSNGMVNVRCEDCGRLFELI